MSGLKRSFSTIFCSLILVLNMCVSPLYAVTVSRSVAESSITPWDENNPQVLSGSNLYAQSAILIDSRTGDVLFSKKPDLPLYPASITKILTALIVLETCNLDDIVTVDLTKMGHLEPTWVPLQTGEEIAVVDLLYGMMLRSQNDSAAALAAHIGGSIEGFAKMMNERASKLGCENSNFTLPHGLNSTEHYTTTRDMAKITRVAMQNEKFREIVSTTSYTMPPSNKRAEPIIVRNGNSMLPGIGSMYEYEGCIGVKTGYTSDALHTYVAAAQRDGISLICVLLGTRGTETMSARGASKWVDAKKLFDYGFASYEAVDLKKLYDANPITCTIENCPPDDDGFLELYMKNTDSSSEGVIVPKDATQLNAANFMDRVKVEYVENLVAPIKKDQKIADLIYNEKTNASVSLFASRDVNSVFVPPSINNDAADLSTAVKPNTQVSADQNNDNPVKQNRGSTFRWFYLLFIPIIPAAWIVLYKLVSKIQEKFST